MQHNTTNSFARGVAMIELNKRGINFNRKEIAIRGCNYDNAWAKHINLIGGWDRLDPEKFNQFILVSFNKNYKDIRYFIFTAQEVRQFTDIRWKDENKKLKYLNLLRNDKTSDHLIKLSENRWDKINQRNP